MTKNIAVLSVLAALASGGASADEIKTTVSCTEGGIDHGIIVNIEDHGYAGTQMAIISNQTIAGPREIKSLPVIRNELPDGDSTIIEYRGSGFNLRAKYPSETEPGRGYMVFRGQTGTIAAKLTCSFY